MHLSNASPLAGQDSLRSAYVSTYDRLSVRLLTPEQHEKSCNYWYVVESRMTAHTAFNKRANLLAWLSLRGLEIEGLLPPQGEFAWLNVNGIYRRALHTDPAVFDQISGIETRIMDNAKYTLGRITEDLDGIRTVHLLNINVNSRVEFDYEESQRLTG